MLRTFFGWSSASVRAEVDVISISSDHAWWLLLSYREVEELLFERDIGEVVAVADVDEDSGSGPDPDPRHRDQDLAKRVLLQQFLGPRSEDLALGGASRRRGGTGTRRRQPGAA
ncbi:hypothetical protein FHS40_008061 [Streptomyces spectabilis]|uniref:Uncharacterized protein n=1 Tax=Streptomyces spectabilis TaxID=68270 RepID=A0A7W8B4A6_STRST|nr:hypothetical protein [Streptomyces spectabilis]